MLNSAAMSTLALMSPATSFESSSMQLCWLVARQQHAISRSPVASLSAFTKRWSSFHWPTACRKAIWIAVPFTPRASGWSLLAAAIPAQTALEPHIARVRFPFISSRSCLDLRSPVRQRILGRLGPSCIAPRQPTKKEASVCMRSIRSNSLAITMGTSRDFALLKLFQRSLKAVPRLYR